MKAQPLLLLIMSWQLVIEPKFGISYMLLSQPLMRLLRLKRAFATAVNFIQVRVQSALPYARCEEARQETGARDPPKSN